MMASNQVRLFRTYIAENDNGSSRMFQIEYNDYELDSEKKNLIEALIERTINEAAEIINS